MTTRMSVADFVAKWTRSSRNERAAAQEFFTDLCRVVGAQTPNEADPHGGAYAFEKRTTKVGGGVGFADVWRRGYFAWENKGKHKDLDEAYQQLLQHREALENPPLLVVCDLNRFEIHTNFTNTVKRVHRFDLNDLATNTAHCLSLLQCVFNDPDKLRPDVTPELVTTDVATRFAGLATQMRERGHAPLAVARFLNRLLFCFFADSAQLLPRGLMLRILECESASKVTQKLRALFGTMSSGGGSFGADEIQWFNGGLFNSAAVLPLKPADREMLKDVVAADWLSIEPAILGTLFERALDPAQRDCHGIHYTDKGSIMSIIEPVIMTPLRREFARVVDAKTLRAFLARLRTLAILDPACGSGNFLYLALRAVKDLEKEAIRFGHTVGVRETPGVGPHIVHGIEQNAYAVELARVAVWIGEIQWMINNGFPYLRDPVLRPLVTIQHADAILDMSNPKHPQQPCWPDAEFIIGNPPFVGGKLLRTRLGDAYVEALFATWNGRVPREADLVTYWHEAAREMIVAKRTQRAGLLATQAISGGANQKVLQQIVDTGAIFHAERNLEWALEGAAVRVAVVCQDDGTEKDRVLDGVSVALISADLRSGASLVGAPALPENAGVSFMGDTKGGAFDVTQGVADKLLRQPLNTNKRPNSDVVRPWVNGVALTQRRAARWIIDFGDLSEEAAAAYEAPFEYVRKHVKPARVCNRRAVYRRKWWLHVEARPAMRAALAGLDRFIGTARNGQYRVFVWLKPPVVPDCQVIVIARSDWYAFGVLQSTVHELWATLAYTRLGQGNSPRYIKEKSFDAFPFPSPLNGKPPAAARRIAAAAEELETARADWLRADSARTLTKLYAIEPRPQWFAQLQQKLDAAVVSGYGWPVGISDAQIVQRLLQLNAGRRR